MQDIDTAIETLLGFKEDGLRHSGLFVKCVVTYRDDSALRREVYIQKKRKIKNGASDASQRSPKGRQLLMECNRHIRKIPEATVLIYKWVQAVKKK